jgi:uncharacterized damage-inducible protein DinB
MRRKKDETPVDLVLEWFSAFTKTMITKKEARAFLRKLPRALEELQTMNRQKTPLISAAEQKSIEKRIEKRRDRLRKVYPEVHGKVVDYITHTVTDGTLYFSVRFKDKKTFRFAIPVACSPWLRT